MNEEQVFVQLKISYFMYQGEENCIIQLVDTTKTVLHEAFKTEKQFTELVNAALSHELRGPLNSIVNQNKNINFIVNKSMKKKNQSG